MQGLINLMERVHMHISSLCIHTFLVINLQSFMHLYSFCLLFNLRGYSADTDIFLFSFLNFSLFFPLPNLSFLLTVPFLFSNFLNPCFFPFLSPFSPTAEAPGHFLSGLPAAFDHHQPHWPFSPSEWCTHTQAFPRATHHSGHALGAALPLQSMKHPGEPAVRLHVTFTTTHTHSLSWLPHLFEIKERGVRVPLHFFTLSVGTLCLETGKGTLRTSWDWLPSS